VGSFADAARRAANGELPAARHVDPSPDPAAVVDLPSLGVRITALSDGLLRLQLGGPTLFDDRPSFQVVHRHTPVPTYRTVRTASSLTVSTNVSTLSVTTHASGGHAVSLACLPHGADSMGTVSGDTWSAVVNARGGLDNATLSALPPMPVSTAGWYVLDDSRTARLEGGSSSRMAWWRHARNGTDLYTMCYRTASGDSRPSEGMRQLMSITGPPPLMPLAAYGVWYSGCCIPELYSQSSVENDVLAQYRNRDLPLDVLVLDFLWQYRPSRSEPLSKAPSSSSAQNDPVTGVSVPDARSRTGWASYSWNRERFPAGEKLYAALQDGSSAYAAPLKLILNHHPGSEAAPVHAISADSEERYAAFARLMGADPKANISFACNFYNETYGDAHHGTTRDHATLAAVAPLACSDVPCTQ
jgi:hypothetical protein